MSNNKPRPLAVLRRAISDHLPNEQEREIHRQVLIQGRMENNVARDFRLTVAQVQHIVCRVERWLAQVQLPIEMHYVRTKHLRRLEHQWREVMTAWYRSCGEEVTTKTAVETRPAQTGASSAPANVSRKSRRAGGGKAES